jgi:hypothetical protein
MYSQTRDTLAELERLLWEAPRRRLCESTGWAEDIPSLGGVYAVWEGNSNALVYIGSTVCLRDRMRDIGRKVNHTCRRKLAHRMKLQQASEADLSRALARRYTLSFLEVDFGRVELEEYLSLRWKSRQLINSPSRRILRSSQYGWVESGPRSTRNRHGDTAGSLHRG